MATTKEMREAAAAFGKRGGKKRARNMTAEQRKEAARKAVQARWAKQKEEAEDETAGDGPPTGS